MNININGYQIEIRKEKTKIPGLMFKPQMTNFSNDDDWCDFTRLCSTEVSNQNFTTVQRICKNYMTHGILEIGISRNGEHSFTKSMLNIKPDNIKYLGVDLDDKSYLNDMYKNVYTIKENSFNRDVVISYAKEIGMNKISILFIDGCHSVNAVINDWQYIDMLSENGIVIFHDTNYHPGPTIFIESIDKNLFRVEKYFESQDDYGLAIAYKI